MSEPIRIRTAESTLPHIESLAHLELLMKEDKLQGLWYCPDEIYFASSPINQSTLKVLVEKTPAHMEAKTRDKKQTKARDFGKKFHKCLLERVDFNSIYCLEPDFGHQKKTVTTTTEEARENRERKSEWLKQWEENGGKERVSHDDFETSTKMLQSCANSEMVQNLLCDGVSEVTIFWKEGSLWCKCKIDYLRDDLDIVDIKTSKDASIEQYYNDVAKYRIDFQNNFYKRGVSKVFGKEVKNFILIVIEKEDPFAVAEYCLDQKWYDIAGFEVEFALREYQKCIKEGVFPAYPQVIQNLTVPYWFAKRYEG